MLTKQQNMASFSTIKRSPITEASPIGFNTKRTRYSYSTTITISKLRPRPSIAAVASNAKSRSCKLSRAIAPRQPSSPEGKFLSCVLQSKPHLFLFSLSEQLKELASDREAAAAIKKPISISMESVLYGRIAELKEKERQTAVEEIMYMSIVHKFSEFQIPLSECISNNNNQEIWPSSCRKLESIHSVEVQEMIREHLSIILLRLRGKSGLVDSSTTTNINRIHLGRIYASSIMYGYFLKSACFRRELTLCQELQMCEKLSNYVRGFDSDSLQRCAKLKSQEAVNVIEKHTWALFGDEKIGLAEPDKEISAEASYLKKLVLEAAAFGSFLWDVESSVDSVYTLHSN